MNAVCNMLANLKMAEEVTAHCYQDRTLIVHCLNVATLPYFRHPGGILLVVVGRVVRPGV